MVGTDAQLHLFRVPERETGLVSRGRRDDAAARRLSIPLLFAHAATNREPKLDEVAREGGDRAGLGRLALVAEPRLHLGVVRQRKRWRGLPASQRHGCSP